jgi:trehalose 6-phosphate phosphatase
MGRSYARPKFREETPRRRTVRPQPAIVTALHNLMRRGAMSSCFFETPGIVEGFGSDQSFRSHLGGAHCASHKDKFLTAREMPGLPATRPPPSLDRRSALFLDVDGTLLEIASRPDRVHVASDLPSLLNDLTRDREGALALVSGRPLADIDRLFRPWRGAAAGLHGIERRRADGTLVSATNPAAVAVLDRLRRPLAALAAADSRLALEDKHGTLALHYRGAPQREDEIKSLAMALALEDASLRVIAGKMVVEFQPRGIDKGTAIAAFLDEPPFFGRLAVFVGDDVTDEDGFIEIRRRGGISIRVGTPAETQAEYSLADVPGVHSWLAAGLQ